MKTLLEMKNKETFLQLHEKLSKDYTLHVEYNHSHNKKAGVCALSFGGDCLGFHKLFAEHFEECRSIEPMRPRGKYTPIRQNIILFLAAINNEL